MVKSIVIAGGGTGGHLFPALAIGEEINMRYPNIKIHYMGSIFGLEAKVFPVKDVWHTLLPIRGLQRDLSPISLGRNFLLPFRIIKSLMKVKTLFNEFNPEIIIGTGGYASAIPLFIASLNRNSVALTSTLPSVCPSAVKPQSTERAKASSTAFTSLWLSVIARNW